MPSQIATLLLLLLPFWLAGITFLPNRDWFRLGRVLGSAIILFLLTRLLLSTGMSPVDQATGDISGVVPVLWRLALMFWWVLAARVLSVTADLVLRLRGAPPGAHLITDLVTWILYTAALLVGLSLAFRAPISGLLATSGVMAIVLGLALQNTLADVFAGLAFGLTQSYRVGELIKVKGDAEGRIVEANWRAVHLRTSDGDLVIVPNSAIARSTVTNFSRPNERRHAKIHIQCPARVRSALILDLFQEAGLLCPEIIEPPTVLLTELGPRWHRYEVEFCTADTASLQRAKSNLYRQCLRLMRHAGVFPRPTIELQRRQEASYALKQLPLFAQFDDATLVQLEGLLEFQTLEAGDMLFRQGDKETCLYIVGSGVLEIVRELNGKSAPLGRIGAGEYLGEFGLLTGEPHQVSASAVTRSSLLVLSASALAPILKAHPELAVLLETSMRHGLDLVDRDAAARASHLPANRLGILNRMQGLFGLAHLSG